MGVKQELSKFYVNQGLSGKHLRKAIQYDQRSIRKQRNEYHRHAHSLTGALSWACSVEGTGYWLVRAMGKQYRRAELHSSYVPTPLRTLR